MARIRIEGVHKTYPNGYVAARGIDLDIQDGELMVLVGASGCGKSTTLRMVAGLETPTSGKIFIDDRDVTTVKVQERDIAMVFQNYALYPHKTVKQNLAFALELRRKGQGEIERRIQEVSAALGLDTLLDRRPGQLSGGQRQRVALGRAIVREPKAFLFDEPLSNLDAKLRVKTRTELAKLHRTLGATMMYVTHDQEEAMTLGDRIAVLDGGTLQQCAAPMEVYRRPANAFVAGFVGNPAMNFLDAELAHDGDRLKVTGDGFAIDLDAPDEVPAGPERRQCILGVRPQDIAVTNLEQADLTVRVDVIETLGSEVLAHLEFTTRHSDTSREAASIRLIASPDAGLKEGDVIGLRFQRDRLHLFDRASGTRINQTDRREK